VRSLAIAFYNACWWLPPPWIALTVTVVGHDVPQASLGAGFLPTWYRSTATVCDAGRSSVRMGACCDPCAPRLP
jgi:hypothetical protein